MLANMAPLRAAWPAGGGPGRWAGWLSPIGVPRSWAAAAFVVSAGFAGAVALFSGNAIHRMWGLSAFCAYAAAVVAVWAWRSRGFDLALVLSVCGALVTPLFVNAAAGRRQPEVAVIARSARALVHHHSPYLGAASLAAAHDPNAYNPYLPVMALFGVPRALFGSHVVTDPRVWFGAAFVVVFGLALRAAGAGHALRWTVLIAASPIIALELAVGGTDVPILALLCLGFALVWRRPRVVAAGVALGLASAAKAIAWPAVVVAGVLIWTRDGRRPFAGFAAAAVAACAVVVAPVAAVWPSALVENTILFPLGLAGARSAAASPLPGHVLADTGHAGHLIAVGLLTAAGVAIAAVLVARPPRTVPGAVWLLAIAQTLMFVLAPATRFGYFIYPLSLVLWLEVSRLGIRHTIALAPPADGDPRDRVTAAASSA